VAKAAEKYLGQPIICTNVAGGSGIRALSAIVKEKPDGYNLSISTIGVLITAITQKTDFSAVKDFDPVIQVQGHPMGFAVRKDAPWKTWQEFIKYAQGQKGVVTVGLAGPTSLGWLSLMQIEKIENVKFTYVPFPGTPEVMTAILGGHITANCFTTAMYYAKSGELKLLLLFADQRSKSFPDVPTAMELYGSEGIGFEGGFCGIVAPKGLPEPILNKLHDAFKKGMEDSEFRKIIANLDLTVSYKGPKEFLRLIQRSDEMVRTLVK
jgi:tripartite-type tricarboxylate transporter receptor subunit TctC